MTKTKSTLLSSPSAICASMSVLGNATTIIQSEKAEIVPDSPRKLAEKIESELPGIHLTCKDPDNPFSGTGFPKPHDDFHWTDSEEIHAVRRKEILKTHPEIKQLFGPEPLTFWMVLGIFVTQTSLAWWIREQPMWIFLLCGYVLGGTMNHTLQLASHELSHNLCFRTPIANKLTAIFSNLVTCFPSAITFQRYHMEHHQYQGVDKLDMDIPSLAEIRIFHTSAFKLLWLLMQPLFYSFRPMIMRPKSPGLWETVNWVACVAYNYLVLSYLGTTSFAYLVFGTLIGTGIHPAAGHFVAEHYEFTEGFETYSYYGSANRVNFNVGYHNEHHDFPKIAWRNLPKVRNIAPEFYQFLPRYTSYISVMYHFVTDPEMGPFSRVKRKHKRGSKHHLKAK
eukprot:143002_1